MSQTIASDMESVRSTPTIGQSLSPKAVESKESTCRYSGMTPAQKKCLIDSWNKMQDGTAQSLEDIGRRMSVWMFENIDDMFRLFFKVEKRKSHIQQWFDGRSNFGEHNLKFAQSFNRLINAVEKKDDFNRCMTEMIQVHLKLETPIGSKYFKQFQERIHDFIMQELDVAMDSEEVVVWTILASKLHNKSVQMGGTDEECVKKKNKMKFKCCKMM